MTRLDEAELGDDFSYILRIADTDIDGLKPITYGLTSVKGIGVRSSMLICQLAGIDGSRLGGVRPDERSIAGQIKSVMKNEIPPIGNYVQCSRGISHSGGGPEQTMAEWLRDGFKCYLLDASGFPSSNIESGDKMGFFLSDDLPMNDNDKSQIGGLDRVSLGEMWLQGHSCIAIVHHILDSH